MITLGIETSCDESGISLVDWDRKTGAFRILSEKIHSQIKLHAEYGGVVPELAAREHVKNLLPIFRENLREAQVTNSDIKQIAVTTGPGLKGCLLSGMLFASGLSSSLQIPLIPVNHVEAHVLSIFIKYPEIELPFIALIVSGGHTELHFVKSIGEYHLLARTIDDAAGEAFDKSASLLGIDYPGGAKLAELADSYEGENLYELPKVMTKASGFSFSGLKTAIANLVKREFCEDLEDIETRRASLAYSIQKSIVTSLLYKTKKSLREFNCKTVVVVGGVSANRRLREEVSLIEGVRAFFPDFYHSRDNGTMISVCALLREEARLPRGAFVANSRWRIETDDFSGRV